MTRLRNYIGTILVGLFLGVLFQKTLVLATSNEVSEIPSAASPPRKSCSLGFSCQATSSCRGGSVIGLCSKKLADNYTLRLRGRIPSGINIFSTRYLGIPVEETRLVLRIYDDNKKPYVDIHFGSETMGLTLVNEKDTLLLNNGQRISKGIILERSPDNFRNSFGDEFDLYFFYRIGYLTLLFKHKNGKYYEVGSLKTSNKVMSSIAPLTGPMDYDILFEQSMSLSIPSSYVQFYFPTNPSPQIYAGPFSMRVGTFMVLPSYAPFEDGTKIVLGQGEINSSNLAFLFSSVDNDVKLKIKITVEGSNKVTLQVDNYFKKNKETLSIDASSVSHDIDSRYYGGFIQHLGFLFSAGHLLFCITETCFAAFEIAEARIVKISSSSIWFTAINVFTSTEHTLVGSAIGKYKCKVGETDCNGSEMRLKNPLSPGQEVEISTTYKDGGLINTFATPSQKDLFGAIAMGDQQHMRAAIFLSSEAVSMVVFNEDGIATDSCSMYLSGSRVFDTSKPITISIGLSSRNKLGVSGIVNGKKTLFCEVNGGLISITSFKPIKRNHHSSPSQFSLKNDYPADGYQSISGGTVNSRSQQQTPNCYLAVNGECNSGKAVQVNGVGFSESVYVLLKSSSVSFPFTIYVDSAADNSPQLAFSVISTGKLSLRNVNTKEIIYAKLPPSCLEKILFEGLSLLLSSDKENVYATICDFLVGYVKSTGLNKKFVFRFDSNLSKNSVEVTSFPVHGGGSTSLDFVRETYSPNTEIKDDELKFASPCDAGMKVVSTCSGSSLVNMANQKLSHGSSVIITGTVEKPTGSFEQVLNLGLPIDNIIQIFSFRAENDRDILQLFITQDQMGLSVHDPNGITYYTHIGAGIPPNINLDLGARYKIGVGFNNNKVYIFIENPFGSGNYSYLARRVTSSIKDWGETMNKVDYTKLAPIRSIVPVLLVKNSYDYALNTSANIWFSKMSMYVAEKEGAESCTLPVYGVCTSSKIYMPGNKPLINTAKLEIKLYNFQKQSFTLYFKKEDGSVVAQLDFSSSSIMWNTNITIKFKTTIEQSTISYSYGLAPNNFAIIYNGRSLGYYISQWQVLLAMGENDNFNQISSNQINEFLVEYLRTSNTDPSPYQFLRYGSTLAKTSMTLGYDQCNRGNPRHGWFSSYGVYYPGSAIEGMCSTSLHPDRFALVIKSIYPKFTKEEVAKTFPNFPGFLQSIVLIYNGYVAYTLIIARKYIVLYNSVNNGDASSFSSCSSQTPDESEFTQGANYYTTFFIEGGYLQVYFHSYKVKKSTMLCKIPYTKHFNAFKIFGQVNVSESQSSIGLFYNFVRTLYSPSLSPSNLYPMGTVTTKNAILSSGMPFSPGESLSIQMNCNNDVVFSNQMGKPQLQLSIQGSQFTFKNILGKLVSTGKLSNECVCAKDKKIVVNIAYVNNQFRMIACKFSVASLLTSGASIYQISSESALTVTYRTDLRLAVATALTASQISKVEEQPDTSKDEEATEDYFIPETFDVTPTMHTLPKYAT